MITLKLDPRFSKRTRAIIRQHRFEGLQRIDGTSALVIWMPGRQAYTDRFVNRLCTLGVVKFDESEVFTLSPTQACALLAALARAHAAQTSATMRVVGRGRGIPR